MFRKLLLPALAIAVLGGCVTDGYGYNRGDYYYGRPGVDLRYEGSPYGSFYYRYGYPGYGGYSSYPYGYGGYYGYPYGYGGYGGYYGYPYSGHPYYPYYPRPPVIVVPRPDGHPPHIDHRDGRRPPWRDLDNIRRRDGDLDPPRIQPQISQPQLPVRPAMRRDEGGSRNEQIMRRARDEGREREIE